MGKKGIDMLENRFLYWMDKIYGLFIKIGSGFQSLLLLYMRLTWGHQFLLSGVYKLKNISKTIGFFTELGIPYPEFHTYLVAYFESIGGLLLMIGFASRLFSIPLTIILIVALSTAHAEHLTHFKFLFDPQSLAGQSPYPYLLTTLMVFCFGPGRVSLDAWIKRWVGHQPKC